MKTRSNHRKFHYDGSLAVLMKEPGTTAAEIDAIAQVRSAIVRSSSR